MKPWLSRTAWILLGMQAVSLNPIFFLSWWSCRPCWRGTCWPACSSWCARCSWLGSGHVESKWGIVACFTTKLTEQEVSAFSWFPPCKISGFFYFARFAKSLIKPVPVDQFLIFHRILAGNWLIYNRNFSPGQYTRTLGAPEALGCVAFFFFATTVVKIIWQNLIIDYKSGLVQYFYF